MERIPAAFTASHGPRPKVAACCGSARSEVLNMWRFHVGTSVKNSPSVRSSVPVVTIRLKPSQFCDSAGLDRTKMGSDDRLKVMASSVSANMPTGFFE